MIFGDLFSRIGQGRRAKSMSHHQYSSEMGRRRYGRAAYPILGLIGAGYAMRRWPRGKALQDQFFGYFRGHKKDEVIPKKGQRGVGKSGEITQAPL